MSGERRVAEALLLLRLGVFVVMLIWSLDKFIRPDHALKVFESFYTLKGLGHATSYTLGALELLLLGGFLAGYRKRLTYGAVFLLHGISTLSSFKQYLAPFTGGNIMFFAAWPMLAACFALYRLRDQDKLCVIDRK